MCDLFSMLAAGGKVFDGVSGYMAHNTAADLAEGNADLLRTQAAIAAGNAKLAVTRGNYDAFLTGRKVSGVLASETAHFASGNVDPTYGSPLLIQGFSAAQGETDVQLIHARMMSERADALTQSANIMGHAAEQEGKAAADRAAAISSLVSGVTGAGTSYLTASSKWKTPGTGGIGDGTNPFALY